FFIPRYATHLHLHSFPTRRSSDLSNAQKKETQTSQKFKVAKTDKEWITILSSEEYAVLRNAATEPPHSSELDKVKVPGTFVCAGDRKSTRLNSSHVKISYAVFCLK